ncbi:MAG: MATE family efflux transporter [Ruminococcaceae bacterium]|nr:MATE family efflux transporter [Oscillospiraceae bacterium]
MAEVRNDFTKGKMWQVILKMAVPMMLAQLVNVLYNVVDRVYIGHIPGVGSLALTGLGLTMPIISVITAFANLCGSGGGPLCSISRGEGNKERAELVMGNTFTLLLIFGLTLTVLLSVFMNDILVLFGASEDTLPYAAEYTRIYLFGTLFVMISLGMNAFINAQGFARMGMLTVIVGAVVNIVLDPIFIFVLDMGIAGAAWATLIAQFCSAAWVLRFLFSSKAILDLRPAFMRLRADIVGRILALGVTGFVMGVTTGLVQIACNVQLQRYGGDLYVGVMTVINSVREIAFLVMQGLGAGAQPVLGYNYGAKAYDRVRTGIRFFCISSFLYACTVWLLSMLIPDLLIQLFNRDAELLRAGVPAVRIYFCGFVFMSMQSAGQCVFVGLGKAKYAVVFSMLRKVIIVLPLVFLLPMIPALGVHGVFWSEPISDLLGGGACFLTMFLTVYRKLGREEKLAGREV